jgi:hypothetical protein
MYVVFTGRLVRRAETKTSTTSVYPSDKYRVASANGHKPNCRFRRDGAASLSFLFGNSDGSWGSNPNEDEQNMAPPSLTTMYVPHHEAVDNTLF